MNSKFRLMLRPVLAGLIALCPGFPCWAALGESAASVNTEAQTLRGTLTSRASTHPELFSVQRLSLPDSTLVDQYVSASGVVFGLDWKGPRAPDLRQLFGSYFAEYQALASEPHVHNSRVVIDTGRMTYRTGGHMRAYSGSARVSALMPAGIEEKDLK